MCHLIQTVDFWDMGAEKKVEEVENGADTGRGEAHYLEQSKSRH